MRLIVKMKTLNMCVYNNGNLNNVDNNNTDKDNGQ